MAVAGGGAIGLAVAWRAAQAGLRVAVLERGRLAGGASSVAAGMLALGYAGWSPGQLENEIQENGWLNCDADVTPR